MNDLSLDIETYSDIDIKKSGLYKYCFDDSFEIMLFSYSVDFGEVKIIDLTADETIPQEILTALSDDNVKKHAYNAVFEYTCLKKCDIDVGSRESWYCTMIHAMYLGYPAGLLKTGEALGIEQDKKKDTAGKALINYFCKPCKSTRANGGRIRNLPAHDKEKWDLFKEYNKQDVVAEMAIYNRVSLFDVPKFEHNLRALTDETNEIGVKVDFDVVDGALTINDKITQENTERLKEISGIENPKSNTQTLGFLNAQGVNVDNVRSETIKNLIKSKDLSEELHEFLTLKQEISKTSISKYVAMENSACADHRVRGMLQHYGANKTGRWAGRLVQMQNLPRNYIKNINIARDFIKNSDSKSIQLIFGNVPDILSQCIRTTFIPAENKKFIVADFSAIEARVLAYIAGETWVNEVFASHGKIYEATASQMFNVSIEKIKKGNPEYSLRQKGKVATLALGYQGGVSALKKMGADKMGLNDEELQEIVEKWRKANSNIVNFWFNLQKAAISTLQTGEVQRVNSLVIRYEAENVYGQNFLTIELPSARKLYYPRPTIENNQFGRPAVCFMNGDKKESTYGGKLTENVVQAIARDCLATTLFRIKDKFKNRAVTVMHIHDEVIVESDKDITVEEVNDILSIPPEWAPSLVLKGAGFESGFYMKD